MARELSVQEWRDKIRSGMRFQEKFAGSGSWGRYKDYYRHKFPQGVIPVNLVFSLLRSMTPQVYFRNPSVTITNRRPGMENELMARVLQTLDQWILQEMMTKAEIKKLIADTFFTGTGVGFLGYDSEFGFDPAHMDPMTGQFSLSQFDKKGYRIEYNTAVNPGMPWFLRAAPEDVIWPWGCTDAKSAEWVAMRVIRPLDDVKADPKYENTKDLEGDLVPSRTDSSGTKRQDMADYSNDANKNPTEKWVELFQIHDARTGKLICITMDHNHFLRNQPDELQIDGLPAETLCFNPDPDFIYGIPDVRIIEPQLLELNEIRTQAMKHRRLDITKLLIRRNALKEEEIQKMTDERVQAVVQVDAETALADVIMPMQNNSGGIMADMAFAAEQVRGDVREAIGFSRVAQGEFQGKSHVSAEETKQVFQALNIRLDERRDQVADLLGNVVRKVNQIIFKHWSSERVARIVGPDGAQWWVSFKGSDLKGEYDYKVTPEEGPDLNSQTKFNMGIQAAEVWAKLNQGAIAQGAAIPAEIQRLLFNQFTSVGLDIDRLLAQSQAMTSQAQQILGAAGQSAGQPVPVGQLAQALQMGRKQ